MSSVFVQKLCLFVVQTMELINYWAMATLSKCVLSNYFSYLKHEMHKCVWRLKWSHLKLEPIHIVIYLWCMSDCIVVQKGPWIVLCTNFLFSLYNMAFNKTISKNKLHVELNKLRTMRTLLNESYKIDNPRTTWF